MKILMVTAEAVPYAKTGGLADSVASLARELQKGGDDVRLLLPLYRGMDELHRKNMYPLPHPLAIHLGREHWARVHELIEPSGLRVYFLEYQRYFDRARIYDDHDEGNGRRCAFADNPERFALLCRAALDLPGLTGWVPDIFHCHDWMAGLVPVFLETRDRNGPLRHSASVLTVHNLAHQGYADRSILAFAGLPSDLFRADRLEACGGVNFLKGGLYFANKLTTVSPTYAEEIRSAEFGCGLQDVLNFRGGDLLGIMNGIDGTSWDPASDPLIPHHYSRDRMEGKALCKKDFFHNHFPTSDIGSPLFVAISRLYAQKGLDVLADVLPKIFASMDVRVAILGAGDRNLEIKFCQLAAQYADRIHVTIGYDEGLAHRLEAAGDFFLMPSRFEPCGLNQLYSLRYGTLPIVRSTGGLRDSVLSYDERTGSGTGFVFHDLGNRALYDTIGWACHCYHNRPDHMDIMVRRAMEQDFGWTRSAARYRECYRWALESKGA
ncbi:MAG: glycogen synthase GlgA [Puniceicoccales bacterium]|jgi:starch synthase|nr:glycogen synthase GlgA [Puniceicoccales bacterium]